MKIKHNKDIKKVNKALARQRIKPFTNLGLPKDLVKEIQEEFMNCFAQGVLYERNGRHIFQY